jgi:16S rRNA (guanine527-N7)-methyltransferase
MSAAARADIAALVERYTLPQEAEFGLEMLARLLAEDPAAATALRHPRRVVDEHLADALVALEIPELKAPSTIADLGSGAGIPGLALAIAWPGASVALVESSARKCEFLRRAALVCGLPNVTVENVRAEAWPAGLGRHDLVTARALASLPVVAEYAAPLLRVGGVLVAWRGRRDLADEAAAARAAGELGLELQAVMAVKPFREARHRHLHLIAKVRPTPARFPRRPGVARKRPLGAAR